MRKLVYGGFFKASVRMGISTFIVKSKINANTKGKSFLPSADSTSLYTEYISKQLINRYNQFSLYTTRLFKTNTKLDKVLLNSITLGFGINEPSRFNTRNEKELYESYLCNNDSSEKIITFKKMPFFGLLSPIFIFKYQLEFQNKKNEFGLLKLNLSYIQGFSQHNTFNLTSMSAGGASMKIESVNRDSGFRIGISKTFRFERKVQNSTV